MTQDPFLLLRIEAEACRRLEYELEQHRSSRDKLALRLMEEGHTWRAVASAAGFQNPYMTEIARMLDCNVAAALERVVHEYQVPS